MLGLFAASHIPYNIEKIPDSDKPSLEEMVDKALDVLKKDKKGFFLFVEGKDFLFIYFYLVVVVHLLCLSGGVMY